MHDFMILIYSNVKCLSIIHIVEMFHIDKQEDMLFMLSPLCLNSCNGCNNSIIFSVLFGAIFWINFFKIYYNGPIVFYFSLKIV